MSTSIVNTGGPGGSGAMWRLDLDGYVRRVEANRDEYLAIPATADYILQIHGVSDLFQMSSFETRNLPPDQQIMDDQIRLEFLIVKCKSGMTEANGRIFSEIYTPYLSPGSRLGKVIRAAQGGEDIPEHATVELTDYLGRYLQGAIAPNQTGKRGKLGNPTPLDARKHKLSIPENLGKDPDEADEEETWSPEPDLVSAGVGDNPDW